MYGKDGDSARSDVPRPRRRKGTRWTNRGGTHGYHGNLVALRAGRLEGSTVLRRRPKQRRHSHKRAKTDSTRRAAAVHRTAQQSRPGFV